MVTTLWMYSVRVNRSAFFFKILFEKCFEIKIPLRLVDLIFTCFPDRRCQQCVQRHRGWVPSGGARDTAGHRQSHVHPWRSSKWGAVLLWTVCLEVQMVSVGTFQLQKEQFSANKNMCSYIKSDRVPKTISRKQQNLMSLCSRSRAFFFSKQCYKVLLYFIWIISVVMSIK